MDGTLIEALASLKSYRSKDEDEPPNLAHESGGFGAAIVIAQQLPRLPRPPPKAFAPEARPGKAAMTSSRRRRIERSFADGCGFRRGDRKEREETSRAASQPSIHKKCSSCLVNAF